MKIINNTSKKGWHWVEGRNWLAVDWLEVWGVVGVLALRGRGEKQRSDQRILGDSEFVQDVISGLDDLVKKNLRLSGQRINIAA